MPYAKAGELNYYSSDRLTHDVGLGDLWSTVGKIFGTVGNVAGKVSQVADTLQTASPYARDVAEGRSVVAVAPRGQISTITPVPGMPIGIATSGIPSWVLPAAIAGAALLFLNSRRRR